MSATPTMSSVMPSPIFVRCCVHAVETSSRHGRPGFASRSTATGSATAMSLMGRSPLKRRPQTGADEDCREICEQVEDDIERRDQERDRLDDRHVAGAHRVDQQEPDALVVEDRLDHDDAAGEVRQVQRGDLERRRERVRNCVTPEDTALRQPLEPGHLHEVALQNLDRRRAHYPRRVGDDRDDERDHGQNELLRVVPGADARLGHRDRRQPREHRRCEDDGERDPDDELW